MSEKVQVKIYGQTYSITGDKTNEQIQEIADYVDERMRLISKIMGRNGTSSTAVLTAVNIGEELFDLKWEDAKKSYKQTKESIDKMKMDGEKEEQKYEELKAKCSEFENQIFDLQMENIQLKSQIEKMQKD